MANRSPENLNPEPDNVQQQEELPTSEILKSAREKIKQVRGKKGKLTKEEIIKERGEVEAIEEETKKEIVSRKKGKRKTSESAPVESPATPSDAEQINDAQKELDEAYKNGGQEVVQAQEVVDAQMIEPGNEPKKEKIDASGDLPEKLSAAREQLNEKRGRLQELQTEVENLKSSAEQMAELSIERMEKESEVELKMREVEVQTKEINELIDDVNRLVYYDQKRENLESLAKGVKSVGSGAYGAGKWGVKKAGRAALFVYDLGSVSLWGVLSNLWTTTKLEAEILWKGATGWFTGSKQLTRREMKERFKKDNKKEK